MGRVFDAHNLRLVKSLNGIWKFQTDPDDCGIQECWYQSLNTQDTMTVPSVWNTRLGLLEYEGVAWYEKEFYAEGGCLRLCFGAVMTDARVWLDGVYVGSHYGGFCQFELICQNVKEGFHKVTVRVDNRFNADSIPQALVDWYHYGGITRDVTVELLKGICILNNRMEYTLSEDLHSASCRFALELYNAESVSVSSNVRILLDGQCIYQGHHFLSAGDKQEYITPEFAVSDVRLWDLNSPQLYQIQCFTDTDDLFDKTGFRKIEAKENQILLNGRPVEIRGINRHEEHPDWGMAFPVGLMQRDLDIISDMGCNAIRGSHYPNAQEFLDMLDSRGIAFWSEIPMWGGTSFSGEVCANPMIAKRAMEMHREMIKYYYNHPCILIWGMHNEIDTTSKTAYDLTKGIYAFLKQHGGNRLVTFATNKAMTDICLELCDIICLNYYTGWYWDNRDQWPEAVDAFLKHRDALGMDGKPVIYSEFGGAAIYGHHTFDDLKGTEEYQAELLWKCLNAFHSEKRIAGFFVWQFCDIRTSPQMGLDRARSYNNKGILNEYRKPKLAYYMVKKAYQDFKKEESRKSVDHMDS